MKTLNTTVGFVWRSFLGSPSKIIVGLVITTVVCATVRHPNDFAKLSILLTILMSIFVFSLGQLIRSLSEIANLPPEFSSEETREYTEKLVEPREQISHTIYEMLISIVLAVIASTVLSSDKIASPLLWHTVLLLGPDAKIEVWHIIAFFFVQFSLHISLGIKKVHKAVVQVENEKVKALIVSKKRKEMLRAQEEMNRHRQREQ